VRTIDCLFQWAWKGSENDAWKQIEGLDQLKTPLSDHLYALFKNWGTSFAALTPDFELMFERFELLGALAHLERHSKADLMKALAGNPHQAWMHLPLGRVGWHSTNAQKLITEFQSDAMKANFIEAKFAQSDYDFLVLFVENFKRINGRMQW
jgi:hypothetical protein